MSDRSKSPVFFFLDHAARAAHFEAAYLNQLEVNKALQERIGALERRGLRLAVQLAASHLRVTA